MNGVEGMYMSSFPFDINNITKCPSIDTYEGES